MSLPAIRPNRSRQQLRSNTLTKLLFSADYPEELIKTIPAQSLFLAVKHNGILASSDVIELASVEQVRVLLDLDCWKKDQFYEENFWEWLSLPDASDNLDILQKILQSIDLKLVALMISRYVTVHIFEDQTENPPGTGFYTPDNGFTWLQVKIVDSHKHFLFSRFLALIHDTSAELFYQLISIPQVSTNSGLEEESYLDKNRRVQAEGIPDDAFALELHQPLKVSDALKMIKSSRNSAPIIPDLQTIEPLLYEASPGERVAAMLQRYEKTNPAKLEEIEAELSLLANAAIVYSDAEFFEYERLKESVSFVYDTLNIGLEALSESASTEAINSKLSGYRAQTDNDDDKALAALGLKGIYGVGLSYVFEVRRLALSFSKDNLRQIAFIHSVNDSSELDASAAEDEQDIHDEDESEARLAPPASAESRLTQDRYGSRLFTLIAGLREKLPTVAEFGELPKEDRVLVTISDVVEKPISYQPIGTLAQATRLKSQMIDAIASCK